METLAVPGADSSLPPTVDADGMTKGAHKYAQIGENAASCFLASALETCFILRIFIWDVPGCSVFFKRFLENQLL